MPEERRKLRLPGKVAWTTLQIAFALSGASCGDDDRSPTDASPAADVVVIDSPSIDSAIADARADSPIDSGMDSGPEPLLFCIFDSSIDGGPDFDAATCSGTVTDPLDCPPGCRAVG